MSLNLQRNKFQILLFIFPQGSKQVYRIDGNQNEILMENKNKYQKQMQRQMPEKPETWYTIQDAENVNVQRNPEKGHKRWVGLPQLVDVGFHDDDVSSLLSANLFSCIVGN